MSTIGILVFDGAEELDFVGPWEVLTASSAPLEKEGDRRTAWCSWPSGSIRSLRKGMRCCRTSPSPTTRRSTSCSSPAARAPGVGAENPVLLDWLAGGRRDGDTG